MLIIAVIAALAAAGIHVYIFVLESLRWTETETMAVFRIGSRQEAFATQALAYNQGFYNLFLAVGTLLGVLLLVLGNGVAGLTLVSFTTACMLLAALVLIVSDRRMARPALVQGLPAAVALVFTLIGA